jgi:serine palmitoyltransferase
LTGRKLEAINFSSYNYLGFAQNKGICADQVEDCVKEYGLSSASTRMEAGTLELHRNLEKKIAHFVGKEDSIIVSMGFATNSTTIPSLVSKVKAQNEQITNTFFFDSFCLIGLFGD